MACRAKELLDGQPPRVWTENPLRWLGGPTDVVTADLTVQNLVYVVYTLYKVCASVELEIC